MIKAANPQSKKKQPQKNVTTRLTEFGGLLCFASIFFFIVGLSGGSLPITVIGGVVFLIGFLCLRHR